MASPLPLCLLLLLLFSPLSMPIEMGGLVCRMPKNEGYSCGERPYAAFFFDHDIGQCIEFMFKGCGGNQNRFLSRHECEEGCHSMTLCGKGSQLMDQFGNIKRCDGDRVPCPASHYCVGESMRSVCCHKADRLCTLSVHTGTPCGVAPQTRYYYDASAGMCRPFAFSGCGGNDNNFKSKGDCSKFCSTKVICKKGDPYPDNYAANRIANCHSDSQCARNYTCEAVGDGRGACCPSKIAVCGSSMHSTKRCHHFTNQTWTFDRKSGECKKIKERVCADQLNSFVNAEQCIDFCIGSCPGNLPLYINQYTSMPQLCSKDSGKGCPLGYECFKSSPFTSICCRTEPVCPAGESLVFSREGAPQRCDPDDDRCPQGFSCQQASNLEHICCSQPLTCPEGLSALRDSSSRPRVCTKGVPGSCPPQYFCLDGKGAALAAGARHLCCRPDERCLVPYVNSLSPHPQKCFPGDGRCPEGSRCLAALDEERLQTTAAADVVFYCCLSVQVMTCQDGSSPLMHRQSHSLFRCTVGGRPACPAGHACEMLADATTACCERREEECIEAFVQEGIPMPCLLDADCPQGTCKRASNGKKYCCLESHPKLS